MAIDRWAVGKNITMNETTTKYILNVSHILSDYYGQRSNTISFIGGAIILGDAFRKHSVMRQDSDFPREIKEIY